MTGYDWLKSRGGAILRVHRTLGVEVKCNRWLRPCECQASWGSRKHPFRWRSGSQVSGLVPPPPPPPKKKSASDISPKSGMLLPSADCCLCLIKKLFSVSAFSRSALTNVCPRSGLLRSEGGIGVFLPCPSRALVNWKRLSFWLVSSMGRVWHCQAGRRLWCVVIGAVACTNGCALFLHIQSCNVQWLRSEYGGGYCIPLCFKHFPVFWRFTFEIVSKEMVF